MSGCPFEYALIRVVPRVDRGEAVNVGLILYCQQRETLLARLHLDEARLRALAPDLDLDAVRDAAAAIVRACEHPSGSRRDGAGTGARFRWLTAPRSTVVQPGPVHAGMTVDPVAEAERLVTRLVR